MRYVIDLQSLQGESRFRGIGRYSLALAEAIASAAEQAEVWIVLCDLVPEAVESIRARFDGLVPQERIRLFSAPGPVMEMYPENVARTRRAEILREEFLQQLNPDVVFVSSLFEGFIDNVVTSVAAPAERSKTAVTLYDLIPLLWPEKYLGEPRIRDWYWRKVHSLRRADLLLAISESARREAIDYLDIPESRVVNISGGVEPSFRAPELTPEQRTELLRRFDVNGGFVLYSGAAEVRKNLDGLVRAFALLPAKIRQRHQLLLVGKHDPAVVAQLRELARTSGVEQEVVFGGYVSNEDLAALYSLCSAFVLPSFHEGFGLPLLEAMACGAAALGSNMTSIPEVVERRDALFDPRRPEDISAKLCEVLSNEKFRQELREHGLRQAQKFTWQAAARKVLNAFEELTTESSQSGKSYSPSRTRLPKMAYVSPMRPEKSGIGDYSAELLPALARHYDIEVITEAQGISDPYISANFPIRDALYFDAEAWRYDRVLYQFGNSSSHAHMFELLRRHPGTVVLHDFFLSDLLDWMQWKKMEPNCFSRALYDSHGYHGLLEEEKLGHAKAVAEFPCNGWVIEEALGIIVHSEYSRQLADRWYGSGTADAWQVIPHPRWIRASDRESARSQLGLYPDDFLVCSFGLMTPAKMTSQLIQAWLKSSLAADERCKLRLVGGVEKDYEPELLRLISGSEAAKRAEITGFATPEQYQTYLAAADAAVQLRSRTRGETSGAVLDCLGHGIPTILNVHGSSAEVPDDVAIRLPDTFDNQQLVDALEKLRKDPALRGRYAAAAQEYVRHSHSADKVAAMYRDAVEHFWGEHPVAYEKQTLARIASSSALSPATEQDCRDLARAVVMQRKPMARRRLLVDISGTARVDLKTGIQRVAKEILKALIENPPKEILPETVHDIAGTYTYGRKFTFSLLNQKSFLPDDEYCSQPGDIWLGVDISPDGVPAQKGFFELLRARGIPIYFVIYDLLPILRPELFPANAVGPFRAWLETVCQYSDGLVCISRSVADELWTWLQQGSPARLRPLKIGYFHLGADISESNSTPSSVNSEALSIVNKGGRPSVLMVGTIEPRKGHKQALDAFELLWSDGVPVNLVIVGQQGWNVDPLTDRIKKHKQLGERLFWMPKANDAVLLSMYRGAAGLLAASEGEGFGLPLIEAARHQVPLIARDLPVFREVAGDHAYYFTGTSPQSLAQAVQDWLRLRANQQVPASTGMQWLTWAQSAEQLMQFVLGGASYRTWTPGAGTENREALKLVSS